jgi:hypothetical protein
MFVTVTENFTVPPCVIIINMPLGGNNIQYFVDKVA